MQIVHSIPGYLAACVKNLILYAVDRVVELVEWIEVMRSLGHDRIFIYAHAVPPLMLRALKHYERTGLVELLSFDYPPTCPAGHPQWVHMADDFNKGRCQRTQLITRNDCLLR